MSEADAVAVILWVGITLYAVFGGADFGAGMWDLLAGRERPRDRRRRAPIAERARAQIDRSIGPVWEANHVWLIFSLVVLWTGFSEAFSAVMTTLYIPLALAVLGIVLRGAGFAFRHALPGPVRGPATRVFGVSSLLTPFFMGTVAGAVASGQVPADGGGDPTASWTGALPLLTGAIFVASAAYLAAVFLVRDAGAAGDEELERYFARRALAMAVIAGVIAAAGVFALRDEARFVYDGLVGPGLPLLVLSGVAGLAALAILARGLRRGFNRRMTFALRPAAVGAVVAVIWGWFVAQHPYLLPEALTIDEAAGAEAALTTLIVVFAVAAVFVIPSLLLLYTLAQRDALE
ncbi:MAG: cytochrome d ubiquinol oxidase subunit II [Solirubrobacterales bacterium]